MCTPVPHSTGFVDNAYTSSSPLKEIKIVFEVPDKE